MEAAREAAAQLGFPDMTFLVESPEGTKCLIVGTAHVSRKSMQDVQTAIAQCEPTAVFVELCDERKGALSVPLDRRVRAAPMTTENIMRTMQQGEGLSGVLQLCLGSMSDKIMDKLGLEMPLGAEFAAAAQAAQPRGIPVILGDRSLAVTLKRAWRSLSWYDRIRVCYELLLMDEDLTEEQIERLKQMDMLQELMQELSEEFPTLARPIVHERDFFLHHTLRHTCKFANNRYVQLQQQGSAAGPYPMVFAVVGMGHVPGIVEKFSDPLDDAEFKRISVVPPPGYSVLRTVIQVAVIAAGTWTVGWCVYRRVRSA